MAAKQRVRKSLMLDTSQSHPNKSKTSERISKRAVEVRERKLAAGQVTTDGNAARLSKQLLAETVRDALETYAFDPIFEMIAAIEDMKNHLEKYYDHMTPMERQKIFESVYTASQRLAEYTYTKSAIVHQSTKVTTAMSYSEVMNRIQEANQTNVAIKTQDSRVLNPKFGMTPADVVKVIDDTTPNYPADLIVYDDPE